MTKSEETSGILEEVKKSKLVKKVIETTRCTAGEAEIALYDNEWDLNTAINSIIERPNNREDWMEKKGRKFKKQEIRNVRRYDNRDDGGNRGARTQGQNFRKDRPQLPPWNSEGRPNRGASGGKNYGANNMALEDQKFPAIDSFDSNNFSKEDNAWKNGPLVFEASSIHQQQEQNTPAQPEILPLSQQQQRPAIYRSSGGAATHTDPQQPLSFAAVAAAKNKLFKPIQAPLLAYAPSQQQNQSHQQSNLEQSHHQQLQQSPPSTSTTHLNDHLDKSLDSPASQFQHSFGSTSISSAGPHNKGSPPNLIASTSMGLANLNINKEFTDKLKSDIGLAPTAAANVIGISSFDSPKTHSDTPATSLQSTNKSMPHTSMLLKDVEFVNGDLPIVSDFQFGFLPILPSTTVPAAIVSSQNDRFVERESQQQPQLPKPREPSLSFVTASTVDYQSNDLRQQQQQVQSQQEQSALEAPSATANKISNNLTPVAQQQQQVPGGYVLISSGLAGGLVASGLENNFLNNNASSGVPPPPGFSGTPFLTQPSFQSLFQVPSYPHPTIPFPLMYPGNTPQQRQPQNHQANLIQQQHQRPSEHNLYMDITKYSQQTDVAATQNMSPSMNSYQGIGGANVVGSNQQYRPNGSVGTAGGMLDNGQYYQQQVAVTPNMGQSMNSYQGIGGGNVVGSNQQYRPNGSGGATSGMVDNGQYYQQQVAAAPNMGQSMNSYQGIGNANVVGNNPQHRPTGSGGGTVGGMLDNGQYYQQQGTKWGWRGN